MSLCVFHRGLMMLCWMGCCCCVVLPDSPGLQPGATVTATKRPASTKEAGERSLTLVPTRSTVASLVPPKSSACFLEDVLAAMREALEDDGQLTPGGATLFGMCAASGSLAVLMGLAKDAKRKLGGTVELLHPTEVILVEEEDDREALILDFHIPQSPLLQHKFVLLLALESPFSGDDSDQITFTSQSLLPNTQVVCMSEGTQYVLLTGQTSMEYQRWMLSIDSKSPNMKKRMKELLTDGNTRRSNVTPVLLFSLEEDISTKVSGLSQPSSFLCELRRFLSDSLPHKSPHAPPLRRESLQAPPPISLDLSSSESVLAELINSSAPTVFSFTGSTYHVHRGELAMPPGLLDELRHGLEQTLLQIREVLRDKDNGHRSIKRLQRLWELCDFPMVDPAKGESQYCAFLLLKAMKTVRREMLPQLRATRAEPRPTAREATCRLRSLTVSLERFVVGPNTANINNCHGQCAFPLEKTVNHAVLLNAHIESGNVHERSPCCVPFAYESLEVVDLNEHGTLFFTHPDMVAKECGCR
ncbi:muellerian-inhibiting factor [Hippocampus zosterae]|uniref:muellerian-inhibiting factor n=1 Tax=Hippocampus zosterae TaxID=109293 RepID=UPI00223DC6B7|nr:muellerian-inhibiting factor [Hippocampus zosterae]XP_051930752.1 muellerian-inhibiting factor [Hippocampus zosterae]